MKRRRIHGGTGIAAVFVAAGLLAPAGATAATRPAANTGAAADVQQTTATLKGSVNPNGAGTTYYFEYGTTRNYQGAVPNPPAGVGNGTKARAIRTAIGSLAPATKYHYRLVARNAKGTTRGADRTFTTKRQPLGLTIGAAPNPVAPGGRTTVSGVLNGTDHGGRQVQLQSNPFPYTQGFQNASNVQLTNPDGTFAFPVLSVMINTQYRVFLPNQPQVAAPIVSVGVAPKVSLHVKRVRRTAHGAIYRFSGSITPAHDGSEIAIQRKKGDTWVTISGTIAKHRSSSASRYRKSVRLHRRGRYRVFAGTNDGDHVQSTSRSVRLRPRH